MIHATVMELTKSMSLPYWLGFPVTFILVILFSVIAAFLFYSFVDNILKYFAAGTFLLVPLLFLFFYFTEDECNIRNKIESTNKTSTFKPNYQNMCVSMEYYERNFVDAVNKGNFDKVKDVIKPNSPLYKKQKALIPHLESRGIREDIRSLEYLKVKRVKDTQFKATIREKIVVYENGEDRLTDNTWVYNIVWDKKKHLFYFTDIKRAK
ncbi:TcaA NTF2-like domain-containing protein [Kurthia gibsonii]|uniref:TcaA NTF2-like domain-containing protein n=1 Tax=Kurthia gibsonii TaxID=33946 RepID=UPI0031B6D6EA